jgi:quercetin dioxygenase-like cupin family protein
MAEITFPAGSMGGEHRHGSIEIIYVLEGVLGHVVNGQSHSLALGMVATRAVPTEVVG